MQDNHPELLLFNLLPYLLSLGITLSLAVFTYRRRSVIGARSFSILLFLEMLGTVGYILELVTPTVNGKLFWDNFQWFTTMLFPVCTLYFSIEYIGRLRSAVYPWIGLLAGIALGFSVAISMDLFPDWGIISPHLVAAAPFSVYTYEFGPLLLAASIFSYIVILIGFLVLGREIVHQRGVYRLQTLIILVGLLIPALGTVLVLLGINLLPNRDISPITYIVANIFVALGLFRYKIFDIIPVARSSVMDYSLDPTVVLDSHDTILDINPAFEEVLKLPRKVLLKRPIRQFLTFLPPLDESLQQTVVQEERVVKYGEAAGYFEINSKPFIDRLGIYGGRLLILHNITRRKQDENQLRLSHDVLEQRVLERTLELEKSNQLLIQEISERKRAEQEKTAYAQELEVLYQLALEISRLPPEKSLDEFLAHKLKDLTQAFFVSLAEYNPLEKRLESRQVIVESRFLNQAIKILGTDPRKMIFPVSAETYQEITYEGVGYRQSLSEVTFGAISPSIGATLQNIFGLEQFIGIAILYDSELEATLTIALQKGRAVMPQ